MSMSETVRKGLYHLYIYMIQGIKSLNLLRRWVSWLKGVNYDKSPFGRPTSSVVYIIYMYRSEGLEINSQCRRRSRGNVKLQCKTPPLFISSSMDY